MLNILGVSGAHRKGTRNTVYLLEEALYAAKAFVGEANLEILNLNECDIKYCTGCDMCIGHRKDSEILELHNCSIKDDMRWIYDKLDKQDAIIFASPVHILGMSSRLKSFIDRLRPMVHQGRFIWKVTSAVSVAYLSIGGQESCSLDIFNALHALQCIMVTFGHGATGISGPAVGGPTPWDDSGGTAVENDKWGVRSARTIGRLVAETAYVVKKGREQLGEDVKHRMVLSYHKMPKLPGRPANAEPIERSKRPSQLPGAVRLPASQYPAIRVKE